MDNYTYTKKEIQRLKNILESKKASVCECGRQIDFGDIAWNNGSTEYGTGYSVVEIECQECDEEIKIIHSWYPEISSTKELLDVIDEDWERS